MNTQTVDVDTVIEDIKKHLGHDWKRLGRALGFNKTELDSIETANPYVLEDQINDLFVRWKMRAGHDATLQQLVAAAHAAGLDDLLQAANLTASLSSILPVPTTLAIYINYLKGKYVSNLPKAEPLLPVPSPKYNNLFLEMSEDEAVGEEGMEEWAMRYTETNTPPKKKKKKSIDISQIQELSRESRLVLLQGAPGVGKSCLAWKLGTSWKDNMLFQHYSLVLLLRLRDRNTQQAGDPKDLFVHPTSDVQASVHKWLLGNDGRGCLLILDGYDELPACAQTDSVVSRIIDGSLLPLAHLIVTSRSSAMPNLLDLCKTQEPRHVEVVGFTEDQVREYYKGVFKDTTSLWDFEKYLECHPLVFGLMYVPLNAAIVVGVYKARKDRGCSIPKTMTELYTALVLYLVQYHHHRLGNPLRMGFAERISDLPPHYHESIKLMAGIAYQGCLDDRLVFDDVPKSMENLGLMEAIPELHHVGESPSISCSFLHKTVQEYLAAYHVSLRPQQEQVRVLDSLAEKPQMRMVCRFLSGLTKFQRRGWWCCHLLWDLLGYVSPLSFVQSFHTRGKDCLVELLHWLYETQQCALVEKVLEGIKKEFVFSGTLSPFDCYVLGYCVVNTRSPWTLVFNGCGIDGKGVEMLLLYKEKGLGALSNVRRLRFWQNPVQDKGAKCIAEAMRNNSCVTELELSIGGLTSAALKSLCTSLHGNTTLTALDISSNSFKDADTDDLKKLLVKNKSLTHLNISLCGLDPACLKEVCSAMRGNTTLASLDLTGNVFDMQSAITLGQSIELNRSLSKLKLNKCGLDDSIMQCLSQSIMTCCSLKALDICSNPFSESGAQAVAEVMRTHKCLEEVDVWSESMPPDGVLHLLAAVKVNKRIKKLMLNTNCQHLAESDDQFAALKSRLVFN